jgi:hypothetical protein
MAAECDFSRSHTFQLKKLNRCENLREKIQNGGDMVDGARVVSLFIGFKSSCILFVTFLCKVITDFTCSDNIDGIQDGGFS